jgi:VCBS repeat-containing protein
VFGSNYIATEDSDARLIGNVLANDSDPDGDPLSISAFDGTSALGATITAGAVEGTFVYDASASATLQALSDGESLSDSFTYTISDGNGGFDTATVTVEVTGADDGDLAVNGTSGDDTLFGAEGNDMLFGDAGDDLFVFVNGTGDDTVTDFTAGAGSADRLDVSDFGFANFAELLDATNDDGADTVITLDDDDSIKLIGVQEAQLHEDDFIL